MINHIVLFKLNENAKQELVELLHKNFLELKNKIPGITSLTSGNNISPEGKSHHYTEGFIVKFESKKVRDDYLPHPEHQLLVKDYILPIIEDVLVFDYETKE